MAERPSSSLPVAPRHGYSEVCDIALREEPSVPVAAVGPEVEMSSRFGGGELHDALQSEHDPRSAESGCQGNARSGSVCAYEQLTTNSNSPSLTADLDDASAVDAQRRAPRPDGGAGVFGCPRESTVEAPSIDDGAGAFENTARSTRKMEAEVIELLLRYENAWRHLPPQTLWDVLCTPHRLAHFFATFQNEGVETLLSGNTSCSGSSGPSPDDEDIDLEINA